MFQVRRGNGGSRKQWSRAFARSLLCGGGWRRRGCFRFLDKSPARLEVIAKEAFADGIEFKLDQQAFELFSIELLHLQSFEVDWAGRIAVNSDQLLREQRHLTIRLQLLLHLSRHISGMGQQVFYGPELP